MMHCCRYESAVLNEVTANICQHDNSTFNFIIWIWWSSLLFLLVELKRFYFTYCNAFDLTPLKWTLSNYTIYFHKNKFEWKMHVNQIFFEVINFGSRTCSHNVNKIGSLSNLLIFIQIDDRKVTFFNCGNSKFSVSLPDARAIHSMMNERKKIQWFRISFHLRFCTHHTCLLATRHEAPINFTKCEYIQINVTHK